MHPNQVKYKGIINISPEKTQNFVGKYSVVVELLIFKYQRQNISVSITLISAVTGPEVLLPILLLLLLLLLL